MKTSFGAKPFVIVIAVALIWTLVVIGFSTSMGARPLRLYDWGPPVAACLLTLVCMVRDACRRG
ncbi:hypothetical protein [Bordetella pseudohinzii]|uniref:Uncharacterized protein n=1 Tax=Bordetella pseudohinzii TaxID=1331258 RepID=A0A0J6BZ81_9BORD|nr:hypothetical protein [Bordetella pseudohinzii]ANY17609.1 hypothetical protein BBN53_18015 [Bordetella pseudohinzii]KMM24018.1 hypothetical protein L540_10555 [Bordetella pseudohinzii]KXA76028.1 hypothetical protein AW877_18115 [Bordetella pseudohinzii]KXA81823.1 hypothetical protein AW878_04415 [Bordetella pseudohinzii]CUI75048.1 Uncharacterised protein [Bordetella pseudohinzii]